MFHTDLLYAQCGSPTSCNNNQVAHLDRLVSAGSKNGFRVLADDAKIGKTGAEYLIIFGARQRRLLPAHPRPRARRNIIPSPSSPRSCVKEMGRKESSARRPSLPRKRDTNHTIAVGGCWLMGGARKFTSTSLQMVDPFPLTFYLGTEVNGRALEVGKVTTRYNCTKSMEKQNLQHTTHLRKLCVVCVTSPRVFPG